MRKSSKNIEIESAIQAINELKLPWGTIKIGPGTVPDAEGSVKETNMKDLAAAMKALSKEGIFDDEDQYGKHRQSSR